MPFQEGMGDKSIPGVKKRALRDQSSYTDPPVDAGRPWHEDSMRGEGQPGTVRQPPRKPPLKKVAAPEGRYGLPSKSEMMFPEAYKPVSAEFWAGLTAEQRYEVTRIQAVAQEKVGFERGTKKYFIEDFDPDTDRPDPEVQLVKLAAPRLVAGGVLLGAGFAVGVMALFGAIETLGGMVWAGLLVLSGIGMLVVGN